MFPRRLNRRAVLGLGASTGALATVPLLRRSGGDAVHDTAHAAQAGTPTAPMENHEPERQRPNAAAGDVDVQAMGFDPALFVRSFDYGEPTTMADGTVVREFSLTATGEKQIEIAPGMFFPAWTYNGTVPGPTLRANEGELLRIHFRNA